MNVQKITVIFIYLVTVFLSFVFADKESNKRMPGSTHAFQQMLRYGRSSDKGKIQVYPRADVFYLGPRYGKRADSGSYVDDKGSCTYTGISNLYRCNTGSSFLKQHRI